MLKRTNEYWKNRSPGAFKANECDRDSLIPFLHKVLDENKSGYWVPIEPDIVIGFFPDFSVPFLSADYELVSISDEAVQDIEDHELVREVAGGRLPDDPITIVAMVDMYNFNQTGGYMGEGPALIMTPSRHELRLFLEKLELEYAAFCKQWSLPLENE